MLAAAEERAISPLPIARDVAHFADLRAEKDDFR